MAHETDLVWGKPGTDVLVTGSAHAPEGRPVSQLPVAFALGPVLRQAVILGDRVWERGVVGHRQGSPQPFTAMPLLWERAFGGSDMAGHPPAWEPRNPVGCGFVRLGRPPLTMSLPNIEDLRARIASPWDRPAPVGFGPIGRHWQPRAAYAG